MLGCMDSLYGIKPEYRDVAAKAYETVLKTLVEGAKTHPHDEWKKVSKEHHIQRALKHMDNAYCRYDSGEDDISHALTRCAMIKYLEQKR